MDSSKRPEGELDFILGNDVGHLYDIDDAAAPAREDEDCPVSSDAAPCASHCDECNELLLFAKTQPPPPATLAAATLAAAECEVGEVMNASCMEDTTTRIEDTHGEFCDDSDFGPSFPTDQNPFAFVSDAGDKLKHSHDKYFAKNNDSDRLLAKEEDFEDFNFDTAHASPMGNMRSGTPVAKAGSFPAKVTPPPMASAATTKRTLPSGKDPESRRRRRLMLDRPFVQASRERCEEAAVGDSERLRAGKEAEIKTLEKILSVENDQMLLLERAVRFVRNFLGPDGYSKVVSTVTAVPQAVAVGGGNANVIRTTEDDFTGVKRLVQ